MVRNLFLINVESFTMKNIVRLAAIAIMLLSAGNSVCAQAFKADQDNKRAEVTSLINSGRYTFVAVRVTENGRTDTLLRTRYSLDIAVDTLIIRLPRLSGTDRIIAGPDSTDHQYTNTTFNYSHTGSAGSGWIATIIPRGLQTNTMGVIRQIKLNINALGNGTLILTGTKHSVISYYGYIRPHLATFKQGAVVRQ